MVLGIFWILLASVYVAQCNAHADCNHISNCDPFSGYICALDTERVCFRRFNSQCHMKSELCANPTEYIQYSMEFCGLIGFMCSTELKEYNDRYAKQENLDDVIYSIYNSKDLKKLP